MAPKAYFTRLYRWRVMGSFEDEIYTIGYVPQLNGS